MRIGILSGLIAASLGACSTKVNDGDGETHPPACSTDPECKPGEACQERQCVPAGRQEAGVTPRVTNPTGTCVAPDDGARKGYHSPDAGDVWLPDCKNTLEREYWRVFAKSETSAYVMPRPDGAYQLAIGVCLTADHPLRGLVDEYALCQQAASPADVARVNDMAPADALAITHYLHTQLLFSTSVNPSQDPPPVTITPIPIPTDILDACALHPDENSAALRAACDQERQDVEGGIEIARDHSRVAGELAPLLNELYGIGAGCADGEAPGFVCMRCGPTGGCPQMELHCTKPCTTSADCVGVSSGQECMTGSCGPTTGCF